MKNVLGMWEIVPKNQLDYHIGTLMNFVTNDTKNRAKQWAILHVIERKNIPLPGTHWYTAVLYVKFTGTSLLHTVIAEYFWKCINFEMWDHILKFHWMAEWTFSTKLDYAVSSTEIIKDENRTILTYRIFKICDVVRVIGRIVNENLRYLNIRALWGSPEYTSEYHPRKCVVAW